MTALVAVGVSAGTSIIVVLITEMLLRKRHQRERSQAEHKRVYLEMLRPYAEILSGTDSELQMRQAAGRLYSCEYRLMEADFALFASTEALTGLRNLKDKVFQADATLFSRTIMRDIDNAYRIMQNTMRRDLYAYIGKRDILEILDLGTWDRRLHGRGGVKLPPQERYSRERFRELEAEVRPLFDEMWALQRDLAMTTTRTGTDYQAAIERKNELEQEVISIYPHLYVQHDIFDVPRIYDKGDCLDLMRGFSTVDLRRQ